MHVYCDDGTYTSSALENYVDALKKAMGIAGLLLPTGDMLKGFANDAGFDDVEVHNVTQPWGLWPKDPTLKKIGQIFEMVLDTGLEVYPTQPLAPLPSLYDD